MDNGGREKIYIKCKETEFGVDNRIRCSDSFVRECTFA